MVITLNQNRLRTSVHFPDKLYGREKNSGTRVFFRMKGIELYELQRTPPYDSLEGIWWGIEIKVQLLGRPNTTNG